MHEIIGVGITIATILVAAYFSNQATNNLRTEMQAQLNSLRTEVIAKLEVIQRDMREFYAEQARHDVRISHLESHK